VALHHVVFPGMMFPVIAAVRYKAMEATFSMPRIRAPGASIC